MVVDGEFNDIPGRDLGHTGVHCGVDGGVAHAGVDNGVSGKADGVVRQRRTSIGRSSVGRGSVVGGGIGNNSDSPGRNGGDQGMSGGGEGQSHNGRDRRRRKQWRRRDRINVEWGWRLQ